MSSTGSQASLKQELSRLTEELAVINRRIENLLTALEEGGWTREVERRLNERRMEKGQVESEVQRVQQMLERGKVELSDEVLQHLAETLSTQLNGGVNSETRALVRRIIKKVEIRKGWLTVKYVPPLALLSSQIHGYVEVPPRGYQSKPCKWRHLTGL